MNVPVLDFYMELGFQGVYLRVHWSGLMYWRQVKNRKWN